MKGKASEIYAKAIKNWLHLFYLVTARCARGFLSLAARLSVAGRDRACSFSLDEKEPKNQGCAAFVVPAARWCNGANPRPPALMAYPMAGFRLFEWVPHRCCNAPPRPARPTAPRPILPPNGRYYQHPDGATTDSHHHTHGEAIRRYHPNADGLACGGSNRQPCMPHPYTGRSHRTSSEPTNEGVGWCMGVASVCCNACGNGLQRSRQAEHFWLLLVPQPECSESMSTVKAKRNSE
ncbi:hypothetical protein [Parapedobacter sp. 10938]|uniref:hypothetical protein n=1 Tax=Parapedobacter flavus TaxID=3110225 RepID=UPI002DB9E439|nr:hypothetical protein [Parapedobacter sp. 10938]MEC3878940.1 hypothetical protein [Parapedobacter sp. 10938]